jgi:putative spermidine/putrescine transport system substrate-binding protein/spermidine/putrescine transport system substrate-binding protein
MKQTSLLLLLALAVITLGSCAPRTATLNLLVWEGYADPSFVHAFEQRYHCKVSASYMGSSDELVAKLRGGSASNYDVISPSSDVATMLANAGLVEPLELSTIPSYEQTSAQLRSLPLVRVNDNVYGVPFMWGPDPLIYDTRSFAKAPESWTVLWDPRYRGKISVWDDLSTVYMAAQVLGYDKPNPDQLYNLTDEQLAKVKEKLLELKPNIRKMWTTGGELTNLFQNQEVVAAMGWPLMTNQLRKANYPVGETIPRENTTGWIDHLMIVKASENKDLAYNFLEYMIEARTQKQVADVTGYIPANPGAAQFMTGDQKKSLHLDDLAAYYKRLYFWQNVPRRAKYNEVWNEVKAAQQ